MSYFITVIKRIGATFSVTLSAMWALYMLFDTVEHVRIVRAYHSPYCRLLDLALAHTPTALYQLAPLALLLACAAVMHGMLRSNEITALLAAGQSLLRRLLPFAAFALALAAVTFAFGETLTPAAQSRYMEIIDLEIKHKNTWGDKWRMDRQWFHGPSGFWRIGGRRDNDRRLGDATLYRMNDAFSLTEILEMKNLTYSDEGRWLADGLRRIDNPQKSENSTEVENIVLDFAETPRHFEYVWRNADEMALSELAESAELRRAQGLSDRPYELARAMRLAYAPLILLLPFLAALIIWNRRFAACRPGLWAGIGLTLGAGLLVFFALTAFKSASEAGLLSCSVAAFLPVGLLLAACLLKYGDIIS